MRIVLDAMGGDHAPQEIVKGAILALNMFDDIEVILVGDEKAIENCLQDETYDRSRVEIVHTTQTIEMAESPVNAIRTKKDSSLVVAFNLVAEGKGQALITAGSTGATVAGATLILRRLPGIKRPALAPVLPTKKGGILLIDCGANVDCKPIYLQQFGIMGSIYMEKVMGVESPRVGLINNGAEEEKGCALTKEAYQLLAESKINFKGNIEGREITSGNFDVAVCDGFVGNIVMKFMEGVAGTLMQMMKEEVMKSTISKLGMGMAKKSLRNFKKKMDYTEYGGALLLGVNGGVIKSHGSSNSKAILSTFRQARLFIQNDVVGTIKEEVEKLEIN